MKKLLAAILILVCVAAFATAESIDISGLSFDDLVALNEKVNLAIWSSEEWQEVTVPQGVWKVGKDIPAGKWSLTALQTKNGKAYIQYGSQLEENKNEIKYRYLRDYVWIVSKIHERLESSDVTEYTVELRDGDYFIVDSNYGPVVFHPYTGDPAFQFK